MKKTPFSLHLSDDAESDLEFSYSFYYEENPKVADIFFIRINKSFESIKSDPYSYPIVYKNVRKFIVKKFPFVVYYQIVESAIKVIAIFHTSRNPEIWNDRT